MWLQIFSVRRAHRNTTAPRVEHLWKQGACGDFHLSITSLSWEPVEESGEDCSPVEYYFTYLLSRLADAFIQSDLQIRTSNWNHKSKLYKYHIYNTFKKMEKLNKMTNAYNNISTHLNENKK